VTITLLVFVSYFAYKVYYQGEVFFIDPQAANKGTANEVIVDEQRVASNPKLNKKSTNKDD